MNGRPAKFSAAAALPWILMLAAAFLLKAHFSHATARDLSWILMPTALLVEAATGNAFEADPALGYVCPGAGIIIAPACAGINFLIIAFCVASIAGWPRFKTAAHRAAWLIASAAVAYGAALFANAVRIIISMWLYRADFYTAWISQQSAHRIMGILIYLPGLYLIHHLLRKPPRQNIAGRFIRPPRRPFLPSPLPIMVYGAVTLLIPLLNGIHRDRTALFNTHRLTVLIGMASVYIFLSCVRLSFVIIRRKMA